MVIYSKNNKLIALFGVNLGGGNLGEEITAAALKQNIKKLMPDAQLIEITSNPGDTAARHDLPTIPIHLAAESKNDGLIKNNYSILASHDTSTKQITADSAIRSFVKSVPYAVNLVRAVQGGPGLVTGLIKEIGFLRRSYTRLANIDRIIIAGSGPLADNFGGAFSYPYLIAKWVFLAKLRSIPIYVFSVGAVPFGSWLSRFFVKYLLSNTEYYSFRDTTSRDIAEGLGLPYNGDVYPDIAFSYMLDYSAGQVASTNNKTCIGISLFPHFDSRYWPEKDDGKYNQYVNTMAEFCSWLVGGKYNVVFLSTQVRSDVLVMNDVINIMRTRGIDEANYRIATPDTHEDFFKELDKIELMVVTRFHGMIMSLLSHTPVIGLANQQKMFDLMRNMGQEEYMQSVEDLSIENLKVLFEKTLSHATGIKENLKLHCDKNKYDLLQGYKKILQC